MSYPGYPQGPSYPPNNQSPYPTFNPPGGPMPGYPSSTPYPPNPSPYPPQSSSYPPHSSPYPPQSSMYPPQSSPYPSQSSAYPPQSTPYPPQPSYPSQGYPAQSSGYPPQQGYSPYHQQHESSYSAHTVAPLHAGGQSFPPQGAHFQRGNPTVKPASPFNPENDANVLRKAMKGFGTDEAAIINVLTNRSNKQRLEIAAQFKTMFGKDLISNLKSELSGKFEDLIVALMIPTPVFLAKEVHHALSGIGTNEETLVEIICTASNAEIHAIKTAYQQTFGSSMEEDLSSDTSGYFKRLLVSLSQGRRDEKYIVDHMSAVKDAEALLVAGALQVGTDETVFNSILCTRSFPQLNQVFMEYFRLSGTDFEDAIKSEFSGDIERGLLAIVRSVKNKPEFFARQLHDSMEGMGTKDRALIRIVVTRCEIDMEDIKRAFHHKYGQSLADFIKADCTGDVEKTLLALIN
uniref:Annexin n=1 Tax=Clastoptera arizonana TaxID=38151 RepID=A0A1B6DTL8_9HEMI